MRTLTLNLYKRFRQDAFHAHDALTAARALTEAHDRDWFFTWQPDDVAIEDIIDPSVEPSDYLDHPHTVEVCFLRDASGEVLASLSGIIDASDSTRRQVESELAQEAISANPLPYPYRPGHMVKVTKIIDPEASDGLEADSLLIGQTGKVQCLDTSDPFCPIIVNLPSGQYNFYPEELTPA